MFEKEAEEYADEKCGKENRKTTGWILTQDDFQKGAEFGYSNANEWHDLRKNPYDLPEEMENVILVIQPSPAHTETIISHISDGLWYTDGIKIGLPIAWCKKPEFEE